MAIAFLDVDYRDNGARAACVVVDGWAAGVASAVYVQDIATVSAYEPGQFYRREMPCLMAVLAQLPAPPDVLVVDGYVWLASLERAGLGAHLFTAMGGVVPVVGIAKTAFHGVDASAVVAPVLRGSSKNALYVTAVGMPLDEAADCVRGMCGPHRIPDILRLTDQLARSKDAAAVDATGSDSL